MPIFFSQLPAAWAAAVPQSRLLLLCTFCAGLGLPPAPSHIAHIAHKIPLSLPLLAAMPVASWPICCASPALVPRPGHHTAQHNQAQPQPRQPPTSFSFRQQPSKGSAICFTATQGRRPEAQNNNETRNTQLTCRSFCCFSLFCLRRGPLAPRAFRFAASRAP